MTRCSLFDFCVQFVNTASEDLDFNVFCFCEIHKLLFAFFGDTAQRNDQTIEWFPLINFFHIIYTAKYLESVYGKMMEDKVIVYDPQDFRNRFIGCQRTGKYVCKIQSAEESAAVDHGAACFLIGSPALNIHFAEPETFQIAEQEPFAGDQCACHEEEEEIEYDQHLEFFFGEIVFVRAEQIDRSESDRARKNTKADQFVILRDPGAEPECLIDPGNTQTSRERTYKDEDVVKRDRIIEEWGEQ